MIPAESAKQLEEVLRDNQRLRRELAAERRTKALYEAVFRNAQNAILLADDDGHYRLASPSASELLGYGPEELAGLSVWALTPVANQARGRELWRAFVDAGRQAGEYQVYCKDGRRKTMHYRAIANVQPGLHMADMHDVTPLKEVQRQLRLFKEAVDSTSQGVFIVRRDADSFRLIYTNASIRRITGYAEHEVDGCDIGLLEGPEGEGHGVEELKQAMRERRGFAGILHHRRRDGTRYWSEISLTPVLSEGDEGSLFVGLLADVSRERELANRREKFASVVEFSRDAIIGTDLDGIITSWNQAAARMFGYDAADVLGRPLDILDPADGGAGSDALLSQLREGADLELEVHRMHRDGRALDVFLRAAALQDAAGERLGISWVMHDVSEVRLLERQLRHAQKMQALGTLAGGIAHDFNNILQGISLATEAALDTLESEKSSSAAESLGDVLECAKRGAALVSQIMIFARQQQPERTPLDFGAAVAKTLHMLRVSLPPGVVLHENIRSVGAILANPIQVHQLVMNLCTNAVDAVAKQGSLRVDVDTVALDSGSAKAFRVPAGHYVRLSVSDTGQGISPELVERIFEPFFTTKAVGEGMGMGLALVHGVVTSHDAGIRVKSKLGKGTTFEVVFPLVEQRAQRTPREATPQPSTHRRLLLVDDEEVILRYFPRWLREVGYEVVAVADGYAALELLDAETFDVLITDLAMPRLSGLELARRVSEKHPDIPIILMTGTAESSEDWTRYGIDGILRKPVRRQQLVSAIERVLKPNESVAAHGEA